MEIKNKINKKQNGNLNKVLYNISKAANSAITLQEIYNIIYKELNTVIDANNLHIALLDKDKVFFAYFIDEKDTLDEQIDQFDVSGTLANYNIKYGKSLLVDYQQIVKFSDEGLIKISNIGTLTRETSWLGVPLKIEDDIIGSMAVVNYNIPGVYSKKDIRLMEFVSEQVATAIERKRNEESLRQSRLEFSHLFQYSPEAQVYVDQSGYILDINFRFSELFGFTKEELLGKNIDQGFIHPAEMQEHAKKMTKMAANKPIKFESIRKKKDGSLFPALISASPLWFDENTRRIVCLYQDISNQKKIEETIRNNEEKFASLFRSNPLAAVYHDTKGIILDINPKFTELFGYTLNEIEGKNIDDINFYPHNKIDEGSSLTKKAQYSGLIKYETNRRKKDGTIIPVHISTSQVKINDELQGIIALYQDITEQKQNEKLNQVLYHISRAANSQIGLTELYSIIHRELNHVIDAKNFYIALLDTKSEQLNFVYAFDEKETNFSSEYLTYKNTLTGYLLKKGTSLILNYHDICDLIYKGDVKNPGEMTEDICWLSVPLKIKDKIIGSMTVQNYYNPESYKEKDIKLMEIVSDQVATAIIRKQDEEKIAYISFHDSLTGLYNRAYFEEELKRMNNTRYYPLSVIMIDVNGLKVVNDTFGHQQGDQLLKNLAYLMKDSSRQGDILSRLGGDEFAVILPNTTTSDTELFCKRLVNNCKKNNFSPAHLNPNISVGFAIQDGSLLDLEELVIKADKDMYQNKLFNAKSHEKHLLKSFIKILSERDHHGDKDFVNNTEVVATLIGKKIGLNNYDLNRLRLLALMHDIGKIGVSKQILSKTEKLTGEEWQKIKGHCQIGYHITKSIPEFSSICKEVLYHHENWDGSGYPTGLKGEKIPLLSRIISIIDSFNTMQSNRPYKRIMTKEESIEEIKKNSGSQFDPNLVSIFLDILKENSD
jgi:diguanylate cyclase (GGDEF)-like protein/PAS domain S-box-containing protein